MKTAKLFENGRSQAVRLPKECRFSGEEVIVNKIGELVTLMPEGNQWEGYADCRTCKSCRTNSGYQ